MFAADWAEFGYYDISWYNKNQSEFLISTPKELAGMAYLVNNNYTSFEGKTIKLNADIDLQGRIWIPIGISNTIFKGTFDGNGHSVSNVSMNKFDYYECGFWTELEDALLQNFKMQGTIYSSSKYIGLLSAKANNTIFKNIVINSNIKFEKSDIHSSTGFVYEYNLGGCVGNSTKSKFHGIKNSTNIEFVFGASSGKNCYGRIDLKLGGLVGLGHSDTYNTCQTSNNCEIGINGYVSSSSYSSPGAGGIIYGGIVGEDQGGETSITTCLSKTNKFEGKHYNGTYDAVSFIYGGIIGKMDFFSIIPVINNCVSITSEYTIIGHPYTWVASWYHTSSKFGGITSAIPKNIKGCFSNKDVIKTVKMVQYDDIGECGSTSYSSEEMQTEGFVNELNFFTKMEYDKDLWRLDEYGNLAFLLDNEATDISNVKCSTHSKNIIGVYDLNGRRLNTLKKGLNVILYEDGQTKKYIKN